MSRSSFYIAAIVTVTAFSVSSVLAGNITGKINFKGAKPAPVKIMMSADPKCVKLHAGKDVMSEQVELNADGTMRDVFIYVKKGLEGKKFPTPTTKATINQQGCMYIPHVLGVMTNQPIEITNSDATLHNIHALPKNSKQFNIAQPKKGMKMTQKFDKSEVMIKIKCEVHSWMASYVGVLDHPFFAVSDAKGAFTLKNLPAGTYEIEAWHEKFGTKTMSVTVGASDTKTSDFTFGG